MNLLEDYFSQYEYLFTLIDQNEIDKVINYLDNFDRTNKIYLIGNGGSFSLSEHFAQDLLKQCFIPAIALTNTSNLTAFSNDDDYESGFGSQIMLCANPNDCLICFSSSGNSKNITYACTQARDWELKVISFTGFDGGEVKRLSDYNIHVPSFDYGIVESMHSILFHYIINRVFKD